MSDAMTFDAQAFVRLFPDLENGAATFVPRLIEGLTPCTVAAGTPLYAPGDACTAIAFVLHGAVRVYRLGQSGREITLYEIEEGDTCILNASCILGDMAYPAHADAITDVTLLLVPAPRFRALVDTCEPVRRYVFALLAGRIATITELVEEVAFGRLDVRLMEHLREKSENGVLEATHQRIANDLGSSREVISRLLKDLERRGVVALSRNRITLA